MATPPIPPGSGPNQPYHPYNPANSANPNDPRNQPYGDPRFQQAQQPVDPRWQREQQKAWQRAQRDGYKAQREQQKAWQQQQREGLRFQQRNMRQQARINAEAQRAQLRAWRRTTRANSLVGPLLLIGFAVIMLLVYSGGLPGAAVLTWFSRWWPLILIAAGIIRIAEWGIARAMSHDPEVPVRFSLGGGTVFLLVLLTVLGFSAQGVVQATEHGITINSPFFDTNSDEWHQFFGSKHEEDAPAITRSIAADGTLHIDNAHGDVTVDGTSDDGLLHVSVHKEVFANSDSRAQQQLADLNPQFSGSDSNLSLRVNAPDTSTASLTLLVPRGVHTVLNSDRGDVHVGSFHAPVVVNANRGDVEVAGIAGDVQIRMNGRHGSLTIHNVQGAVQITGSGDELNLNDVAGAVRVNGDFFGSGRLQHVSSNVDFDAGRIGFTAARIDGEVSFDSKDEFSATGITGPVTVKTRSRDISLSRISGDVRVSNSSGHVDIVSVPPTGSITVDNRDGDVSLSLPANAHFTVNAETSDGSVTSDFPGANAGVGQTLHGSLTATVGSGGNPIHVTTTHGNISLARNDESPIAPVPPVPPLSFTMPDDAKRAIKDAQNEIRKAQVEGQAAMRQGLEEGRKAREEAQREAAQARKEADQERREALREAEQERRQAQREADQSRREALREAAQARKDAQHQ